MRKLLLLVLFACTAFADTDSALLPELRAIHAATLSPSYSCRSREDFQKGYEQTALFVSAYSKRRNSPDLLFNGACRADDYFKASTAGDDMSLIADLGDASLESLNASRAFNVARIHSMQNYTRFAEVVPVIEHHTYAVLLNKAEIRGLVIFSVDSYTPNKAVRVRYTVLEYQLLTVAAQSPGFAWEAMPTPPGAPI